MKQISLRIAVALLPVLVLVLALFGVATAMREGEVIQLEMQRDADAVALALAQLLAVDEPSETQAQARLAAIDAKLPHLRVSMQVGHTPDAHATSSEAPDGSAQVAAVVPVPRDGEPWAWVVVAEPLRERDSFVRRALLADAVGVLVATLLAWAVAVAIGRVLVQTRVVRLSERLEAVGRGEYEGSALDLGSDELGMLAEAVERMTAHLREARQRAAEELAARRRVELQLRRADRLAVVGRTVAVFAHEVGTPLAVIVGRAERLQRRSDTERVQNDAGIILAQSERITAFVRRLLDYVRHDDAFELLPVDVTQVARAAVSMVADRARQRGISLEAVLPSEAIIEADARALEQVLINLLNNAVDASEDSSVVRLSVGSASCGEGAHRGLTSPHLHLEVEDGGSGVPEVLRERIFAPFFTTKAAEQGTGLGLSIVAEIVRDHGGLVTVHSGAGGGGLFVVHLPGGEVSDDA